MKKILLGVLSAMILLFSLTGAAAASNTFRVSVDSASGKPGDEISVAVRFSDNPGICSAGFSISYDKSALTFVSWTTDGTVFSKSEIDGTFTKNPMIVSAFSGKGNKTANGVMMTLHFTVRSDAKNGDYPITLQTGKLGGFYNFDEKSVQPSYQNGSIQITGAADSKTPDTGKTGGTKKPDTRKNTSASFSDVHKTDWYYDSVAYVGKTGLMTGTSGTRFSPELPMSRAMLVTILWRLDGSPASNERMRFQDVPKGTWYTEAVRWAAGEKIVKGISERSFAPDTAVTREQMATILYRFAEYSGIDVSGKTRLTFPDASKVGSWAKTAVQWACAAQLLKGSNGKLMPQGTVTRAQAATIFQRFCENTRVFE